MSNTKPFVPPSYEEYDENDIDLALKDELKKKKLAYRFIDFKQAKNNGGRSRAGWVIYKRESKDPILGDLGMDSDKLVRKGTLVLAVKPQVLADKQKSRVASQNDYMNKYNKIRTKELDSDARKLGGSSRAIEGFENNS